MDDDIKRIKQEYPKGTRVVCIRMEDPHGVPERTEGTVKNVDDIGTIHVAWENGSTLGLIPGHDIFKKVA